MKRTAFASLFAFALATGAAQAHTSLDGNIVGGGGATIIGGGDNTEIAYSVAGAGAGGVLSQSGRLARFAGGHGDGLEVQYLTQAPAGAGREAWLVGGGDNAEVTYDRRR